MILSFNQVCEMHKNEIKCFIKTFKCKIYVAGRHFEMQVGKENNWP